MLTASWFIPLVLLTIAMLYFISNKINGQLQNTIETSSEKAIEISQMRLADAMNASKHASYSGIIRESYQNYQESGDEQKLYQDVNLYLAQQYKYNTDFKSAMLYFTEKPDVLYFTYSNIAGSTYDSVKEFEKNAREEIQDAARKLDTYIGFLRRGGSVYMVRNLVNSQFEPYAVLVMELNPQEMFGSLESIWGYQSASVFVDGVPVLGAYTEDALADQMPMGWIPSTYLKGKGESYVYARTECDRHTISYAVRLDNRRIIDETYGIRIMGGLFAIFMIPLVAIVFLFFHKKVTMPIADLVEAYGRIEKEEYGCHIPSTEGLEEEFFYLNEAFNRMSDKLKYQFEKIYLEELALRDASIMALQSQINPHFLNNTLEIINWEARMNGNYKVSGMIEALSTMMEATMNRKRESSISLAEELSYVDAYLYIIKERFGDRFSVEKEIDEALLSELVPRLIIQPVVENAVEHGMDIRAGGKVKLHIYREGDLMHIDVWDNGKLTEEKRQKIEGLLHGKDNEDRHSLSLGIRNVNKRLKMVYGPESGLSIKSDKNNHTISTLLIKLDK